MRKYRLVAKKGEGTFSEVLKAQNVKDGKYHAIKCMKNHFDSIDQVNNLREIQVRRARTSASAPQGAEMARRSAALLGRRCAGCRLMRTSSHSRRCSTTSRRAGSRSSSVRRPPPATAILSAD